MLNMFWIHTATVETYRGNTPTGPSYATPVTVQGFLVDEQVLANEKGGVELVAKTTFYTPLDNAALFTPDSRVTCNARSLRVKSVLQQDGTGSVWAALSHAEVILI